MKRRLLSLLTVVLVVVALVAGVATLAVWSRGGFVELGFDRGRALFEWRSALRTSPAGQPLNAPIIVLADQQVLGVGYRVEQRNFSIAGSGAVSDIRRRLYIPLWLLLITAGVGVVAPIRSMRERRRRLRERLCIACGYDLRATPERCPECGAVPAAGSTIRAGDA